MSSERERALVRVRQLIALACNPAAQLEEGRTAGLLACKLIDRFHLLDGPPAQGGVSTSGRGVWASFVDIDSLELDELLRTIAQEFLRPRRPPPAPAPGPRRAGGRASAPPRSPPRPAPPPPPPPPPPPRRHVDPLEREHRIRQAMNDIRIRVDGMTEDKMRSAAAALVDEEIRRGI